MERIAVITLPLAHAEIVQKALQKECTNEDLAFFLKHEDANATIVAVGTRVSQGEIEELCRLAQIALTR